MEKEDGDTKRFVKRDKMKNTIVAIAVIYALLIAPVTAIGEIGGDTVTITVNSYPAGAEVYDNGVYQGITPCKIVTYKTATPVNHNLKLTKVGFYDYYTFVAHSAENQRVNCDLKAVKESGYLNVVTDPSGARIYIDDDYKGLTSNNFKVDVGSHKVRVEKDGFSTWQDTVRVYADKTTYVNARLTTVTTGSLDIKTIHASADVYLDNVYKGISPLSLTNIPAGSHVLTLKAEGYVDYTDFITVMADKKVTKVVVLQATPEPTTPVPTPTKTAGFTWFLVIAAVLVVGLFWIGFRK